MFGIGSAELVVILVVALLVLGPKSLASASRTIGKYVGEFRRASSDFQRALNVEAAMAEEKEKRATKAKKAEEAAGEAKAAKKESEIAAPEEKATGDELVGVPPDSPVAQALAKAKNEAARANK